MTTATRADPTVIERTPEEWRAALFAGTYTGGLAQYHDEFWDWLWSLCPSGPAFDGHSCFCAVWARGWAKSTNVECGCVALAAKAKRRYGWYICSKQSQADDHVATVSARFLAPGVVKHYPLLAEAKVQMIGPRSRQLGWRRNRLWTADGFALDALGLDTAIRGAKLMDNRPDFMIFDDVDEVLDAEGTIDRKIIALERTIIPAAAPGCIYLVAQNLIHPDGIVTRLVDGRATYLGSRTVSGPHPAIENLVYEGRGTEAIIVSGRPTWSVLGLQECQQKIVDAGIGSFLAECQHEITLMGEPRFDRDAIEVHEANVRESLPAKALPDWAQDRYLSVWQLPIAGVPYVAYFDGAEGTGGDYCVTVVLRADTRQLVAMLRDNKREQGEHAGVAVQLIREYNGAYAGWERSHEADFASVLAAEGITRVYWHPEDQTLAQRAAGTEPSKRRGYPARQRERRALVSRVARYLERHEGAIPSAVLLRECKSFIKTAKQPDGQAAPGTHDDTVFGFGGALIMCEQPGVQSIMAPIISSGSYGYVAPGHPARYGHGRA